MIDTDPHRNPEPAPDADSPVCWHAVPAATHPVALHDLWALFNPVSGETHLIDEAAMAVLDELADTPASLPLLVDRLRRRHALDDSAELHLRVDDLLHRLDELGLVERRS